MTASIYCKFKRDIYKLPGRSSLLLIGHYFLTGMNGKNDSSMLSKQTQEPWEYFLYMNNQITIHSTLGASDVSDLKHPPYSTGLYACRVLFLSPANLQDLD